jgi:AraC-like DNA-binding protein
MLRLIIPAPPDLEEYISHYVLLEFTMDKHGNKILCTYPEGCCVLSIFYSSCLPEYIHENGKLDSMRYFIAGLLDKGVSIGDHVADYKCILVFLKPISLLPLFGIPSSAFVNVFVPWDDVIGTEASHLADAIASATTSENKVVILNKYFRHCLGRTCVRSLLLPLLANELYLSNGVTRVHDLMHKYNVSGRHIDRLFHQFLGVTPKQFARLARLGAAFKMLLLNGRYTIHDVIYLLNYFDQAHLNHDFASYSHITPYDLLKNSGDKILIPKMLTNQCASVRTSRQNKTILDFSLVSNGQ